MPGEDVLIGFASLKTDPDFRMFWPLVQAIVDSQSFNWWDKCPEEMFQAVPIQMREVLMTKLTPMFEFVTNTQDAKPYDATLEEARLQVVDPCTHSVTRP